MPRQHNQPADPGFELYQAIDRRRTLTDWLGLPLELRKDYTEAAQGDHHGQAVH